MVKWQTNLSKQLKNKWKNRRELLEIVGVFSQANKAKYL